MLPNDRRLELVGLVFTERESCLDLMFTAGIDGQRAAFLMGVLDKGGPAAWFDALTAYEVERVENVIVDSRLGVDEPQEE